MTDMYSGDISTSARVPVVHPIRFRSRETARLQDVFFNARERVLSVDTASCPIHPNCLFRAECDRSICGLFFHKGKSFADLTAAVSERLESGRLLSIKRDVRRFAEKNRDLFRTTIPYSWMCVFVYLAKMEAISQ